MSIIISDQALAAIQQIRSGKYTYAIFVLDSTGTEVGVEKQDLIVEALEGEDRAQRVYQRFLGELPEDQCRFVIVNFEYLMGANLRVRPVLVKWAPGTAKLRQRMRYASANDAFVGRLRTVLPGLVYFAADGLGDLEYSVVVSRITGHS